MKRILFSLIFCLFPFVSLAQGYVPDDVMLIGNGNLFDSVEIPNCPDEAGNHLNYVSSSNTVVCGNSNSYSVPVGTIVMTVRQTADDGWLLLDGSQYSRTEYADLFAIMGTTYGAGDGITTFNVPDMRQRFPLGKAASGTGNVLGQTGGAIDHAHTLPAHYHGKGTLNITSSGAHAHEAEHNRTNHDGTGAITLAENEGILAGGVINSGGAHTHPNSAFSGSVGNTSGVNGDAQMTSGANNPPYLVVNFQIKY